ncbi:MAG: hypothetical protein ACJA0V_003992 [Planctomycetota bacterium]|jgi:hypothetical protein
MKRRTEHLVEKRDGRREFLRATKLARSVHLALFEIGVDEDWRALEIASVVLEGLRQKRKSAQSLVTATTAVGGPIVLTTTEIADSVQHLLVVTGQPTAAVAYGAVQAERARRRQFVGVGVAGSSVTGSSVTGSSAAGMGADLSRPNVGSIPKALIPKALIPKALIPKAGPRAAKSGTAKNTDAGKPNVKPANRIWGEG